MLQYFMRSPLEEGHPYVFGDWPIKSVPTGAAGIYTIWREPELIYVGMAGRGKTEADLAGKRRDPKSKPSGLYERLGSHATRANAHAPALECGRAWSYGLCKREAL